MHFYLTPAILRFVSRKLQWRCSGENNEIYLTFDDGPIPVLTPYILEELEKYQAKATFFCVGDNIRKNPKIFEEVVDAGHAIGNHTFNHLKAWRHSSLDYFDNVKKCQLLIDQNLPSRLPPLFRPPYGQITRKLISQLGKQYQIVMWDVLSYDFSNDHTPSKSLKKIQKYTRPGSIVLFHDNYKAEEKLRFMLPRYLRYFHDLGYKFKKL